MRAFAARELRLLQGHCLLICSRRLSIRVIVDVGMNSSTVGVNAPFLAWSGTQQRQLSVEKKKLFAKPSLVAASLKLCDGYPLWTANGCRGIGQRIGDSFNTYCLYRHATAGQGCYVQSAAYGIKGCMGRPCYEFILHLTTPTSRTAPHTTRAICNDGSKGSSRTGLVLDRQFTSGRRPYRE